VFIYSGLYVCANGRATRLGYGADEFAAQQSIATENNNDLAF
jgi:hypothetical protein